MSKKSIDESTIEEKVARQLREAGFDFESQLIVGNARPDFLIKTPDGQNIVLEIKGWSDEPENVARAAHQAKRYKQLTNAAAAFVAITGLSQAIPDLGVLSIASLVPILESIFKTIGKRTRKRTKVIEAPSPEKKIFAAMPFSPKYDDTFLVGMQPAAIGVGAVCDRMDHAGHYGDVVNQIKGMISDSSAVIADLSESKPNVCYETGFAEAQRKPVIQICSTSLDRLPFDLRNNATIKYSIGQTTRLQKRIKVELQKIF